MAERKKTSPKSKNSSTSGRKSAQRNSAPNGRDSKSDKQRKKAQVSHEKIYWLPGWFRFLIKLSLVGVVCLLAFLVYLDATLRQDLDSVQWELPAQVYARPLELYPGKQLSLDELSRELKALGYRFQDYRGTGYALQRSNSIRIHTRGFQFVDEHQAPAECLVTFRSGRIDQVRVNGQERDLFRLEPLLLGSLFPNHHEDRQLVQIDEVPDALKHALIATEDRDFYQHHGVSPKSIVRAMLANFQAGSVVQGGSTLTQQLIKNLYLTRERTYTRKLQEAAMALLVDLRYPKDKILETYLNEVYLGQDGARAVHGVMAASYFYFGVPVRELKLHQIALMVAVVKGPAYYNPKRHPERALTRRNLVLDMLTDQGYIEAKVANWSKRQPLDVVSHPTRSANRFPAYLGLVHRHLKRDYSEDELSKSGLRVFTSLDPQIQWDLEQNAVAELERLARRHPREGDDYQLASVVTSVDNGEVVAVIGDRNVGYSGFNRALDAKRPIGSLAKPAVFLTALQRPEHYSLTSVLKDQSFKIQMDNGDEWQPRNFDNKSHGDVLLYQALAKSYNQATARLGLEIGLDAVIDTFRQFGFSDQVPMLPATMLGSLSLSPYEITKMYQTLAADGFRAPLKVIRTVTDAEGEVLDRYPLNVEQVFDQKPVYLVNYAMQVGAREGTGRWLNNVIPSDEVVFGKTGTSNQQRDSWFAGVKGNYLSVTWVGKDDNSPTELTGSSGALRVWGQVMRHMPASDTKRVVPDQIGFSWVDQETGLLVDELCSSARLLPFIEGSAPTEQTTCKDSTFTRGKNLLERLIDW
ncbi:penicillin-binding protein 1B [Litoribrevibacter albus]|uniref:Penicillin-binding protein 1B n=1 Tax=Litoribrevibacter albus TaxID=1473156 RepID=A0AA37W9C3_9GAMM|nr:penicillin-binding protein 1B [Litoribrevibacter albus]GLQ33164.1 penicillin-binding protein 1B [Litoribrevibacter albus]